MLRPKSRFFAVVLLGYEALHYFTSVFFFFFLKAASFAILVPFEVGGNIYILSHVHSLQPHKL